MLDYYKDENFFQFRILGYGLCIKHGYPWTFSQRNGYSKFLQIGPYTISVLTNDMLWTKYQKGKVE